MKLRTRILLDAIVPVCIAIILVTAGWVAIHNTGSPWGAVLQYTVLGAAGGLAAVVMSGWMYRRGQRLAKPLDELAELAREKKGGGPEDELDALSSTVHRMKEQAANHDAVTRRYEELSKAYDALREASERTEAAAEVFRRNEVRTACCLERLERAEQAMTERTRTAMLGDMLAGLIHGFIEKAGIIVTQSGGTPGKQDISPALEELLQRMKLYTRLTRTRVFKPELVSLKEVLDETVMAAEPRWRNESQANGIHFEIKISCPADLAVHTDRSDLMEMLLHLLDNAIAAMPLGGLIQIAAHRNTSGQASISVIDRGAGMSEELRRVCCEPFVSTREGAAGVGLAIVSELAKRNRIRFGIQSSTETGTTVLLEVPCTSFTLSPQRAAAVGNLRPLSILVVDDSRLSCEVLAGSLQPDGHIVDSCTTGAAALERMEQRKYDVLITDRAMPGMSGLELAQTAKRRYPGLPVIMLTGFADTMKNAGFLPPHIDCLVAKPANLGDIQQALMEVTRKDKSGPSPQVQL